MRRSRIGLDIGATGVRAAELSMRTIPVSLVRVAQVPLADGTMSNGEVRDPEVLATSIRELWRVGRFRSKEVVLGVANQRVVVREVSVPWLAEKELRESLPFQVQEFVPMPLEEAVLDYHILEEFEREGRRMVRLLLVAAHRPMIQQIVQAVEMAKLTPVGMDLVPFAIVRSVGSLDGLGLAEDAALGDEALVHIGAEVTSICVHAWGVPRFVRILPLGCRDIRPVSGGLREDEQGAGFAAPALFRPQSRHPEASAGTAVEVGRANALAEEISSSVDFYLTQMPGARIVRVLVTGGGSQVRDLIDMLADRLPADVAVGHPFHRVHVDLDRGPEGTQEAEPLLAVAVGLALPGVRG